MKKLRGKISFRPLEWCQRWNGTTWFYLIAITVLFLFLLCLFFLEGVKKEKERVLLSVGDKKKKNFFLSIYYGGF